MSDVESDTENLMPLTTNDTIRVQHDSSNVANEKYYADKIERLLKMSKNSRECIIIKNSSHLIKSNVWKAFGFPGKLKADGEYQLISGFVCCFNCCKKLPFDGSTKYMNKHKCSTSNAPNSNEKHIYQRTIDKYAGKKIIIQKQDKEKLKEKMIFWSCSSIKPFTILEDLVLLI